ncbi:hypothetical protein ACJX0J_036855, partial [Zea mays]
TLHAGNGPRGYLHRVVVVVVIILEVTAESSALGECADTHESYLDIPLKDNIKGCWVESPTFSEITEVKDGGLTAKAVVERIYRDFVDGVSAQLSFISDALINLSLITHYFSVSQDELEAAQLVNLLGGW